MTLRITVPDQSWLEALSDLDFVTPTVWDFTGPQPDGEFDFALRPYVLGAAGLDELDAARLGVIQSQALGFDGVAESLSAGATYCNAVDVHEPSTAELAMALALGSQRHIDDYARNQAHGTWEKQWAPSLLDKRVMLLGVGGIGTELLARLSGFGVEIVRVGRSARTDEYGKIHATTALPKLLPQCDVVFIAVPHDDSTDRLVDATFLAALPDDALVVNVSRGKVADTAAVLAESGRIRYATDVTDPEPLPQDHPLWRAPGVLISPHVGGLTSAMRPRMEAVVRSQLDRLRRGEEPHNIVVRT